MFNKIKKYISDNTGFLFRLDDIAEKSALIQLFTSGQGNISKEKMMEIFNVDSGVEKSRIKDELKEDIDNQYDIQDYQKEKALSLEEQAKNEANMSNGSFAQLNQNALIQEADTQAQQLMQMDPGQRKSSLDEMSKTNQILYAVVKSRMEFHQQKQGYQAAQEANQG